MEYVYVYEITQSKNFISYTMKAAATLAITLYVLSPKKWISLNSFSTYYRQNVLSQPYKIYTKVMQFILI